LIFFNVCTVFCCRDVIGGKRYAGKERIPGQTVIITGATSGIGKETAKELADRGALNYRTSNYAGIPFICHFRHITVHNSYITTEFRVLGI